MKTADMSGVAGRGSDLLHPQQHRIVIAVDSNFMDDLKMSGGFAFLTRVGYGTG